MQYEKVDDKTLKVIKTSPDTEIEYNVDFLKEQEVSILKSKNDFIEARNVELVEVRALIAKCVELDIKSVVEVELEEEKAKELI